MKKVSGKMENSHVITQQPTARGNTASGSKPNSVDGDVDDEGKSESAAANGSSYVPLGVQQLAQCSSVKVHQHLDCVEVCLGFERPNRYSVLDENDEQMFYIYEVSQCAARQCAGSFRFFLLKALDQNQDEVFWMRRPLRCSSRCLWACCSLQEMDILNPGFLDPTGTVKEVWSCCIPQFVLMDNEDSLQYNITGECMHLRCCCDVRFKVTDSEGETVAQVERTSVGCREVCGAQNDFTVSFSEGLDVKNKIKILSAMFLVDFNYFEKHGRC